MYWEKHFKSYIILFFMSVKLRKISPTILFTIVLALLIIHIFGFKPWIEITIDNTTILLLILLMIIPFIPRLRKFNLFGLFEGEIQSEEVKKIKNDIENLPEKDETYIKINWIAEDIFQILEYDEISALAKLRIELERVLERIYCFKTNNETKRKGLNVYIKLLQSDGTLKGAIISPLKEVINVCNRAIHGEDIKRKDAELIIEYGLRLLDELYMIYDEFITEPYKTTKISIKNMRKYFDSEYEVTTIIPLVEEPIMNKRILTQEGLNALLEGYEEYAEFLIDIKRIEKKKKD